MPDDHLHAFLLEPGGHLLDHGRLDDWRLARVDQSGDRQAQAAQAPEAGGHEPQVSYGRRAQGSLAIAQALEQVAPTPSLYPSEPAARAGKGRKGPPTPEEREQLASLAARGRELSDEENAVREQRDGQLASLPNLATPAFDNATVRPARGDPAGRSSG